MNETTIKTYATQDWVNDKFSKLTIDVKNFADFKTSILDGKTDVTLVDDIEVTEGFAIYDKNFTIDLNGKTLSFKNGAAIGIKTSDKAYDSSVTIKNGKIKTENIEDPTFYASKKISDDSYKANYISDKVCIIYDSIEFTLSSCTSEWAAPIYASYKGSITVKNCTMTSPVGTYMMYVPSSNANVTIFSGNFNGDKLRFDSGSHLIFGGTFSATGERNEIIMSYPWSTSLCAIYGGTFNSPLKIYNGTDNTSGGNAYTVTIYGGTFEGLVTGCTCTQYQLNQKLIISGGKFKFMPTENTYKLETGYNFVEEGGYFVCKKV